jgi:hypothetical protein
MAEAAAQKRSAGPLRTHIAPSHAELDAAARLGAVFRELARMGEKSLGPWAVIPDKGYGDNYRTFNIVLGTVYGTDSERARRPGKYLSRAMAYRKDVDAVMRLVLDSALQFAHIGLNAEIAELRKLYERLSSDAPLTSSQGIAQRLHEESKVLVAVFEREKRKAEAAREGQPPPPDDAPPPPKGSISYLTPREIDEIFRDKVLPLVPSSGNDLLSILAAHPEGRQIIAAYAQSPGQGTVAASRRVLDAIRAVIQFTQTAVQERRALRYPFFVLGGVARLGLNDVPGFKEFAVNYCQVLMRDVREKVLMFAGGAVAIFALVLAGPGLAQAVALVLLAGTELAFAGWNVSLVYAREREQDFANRASRFKGRGNEWATPVVYQDTIMAGAAALLSGIAFFGSLKELRKLLKTSAQPALETAGSRPVQQPAATSEELNRSTAKNQSVAGVRKTEEKDWRDFLPEAQKRKEAARDKTLTMDYESTTYGPDAQANANRSRATERPEPGKPKALAHEPATGDAALSETTSSSRATKPAQKAASEAVLPVTVQDKLEGKGNWTKSGNVSINHDLWELKRAKGPAKTLTWEQFEEAANRELFGQFAEQISDKPVRRSAPGDPAFARRSTLTSNEFKLQKEFRGRLGEGATLVRRPDGSMEVIVKKPGGTAYVGEVHFMESTLQNDFEAEIGYAGGKQRQVSGTTWLSNKIPKYKYTQDTRLYYNIFCPEPPTEETIKFLNSVSAQNPNLEFNWFVVK